MTDGRQSSKDITASSTKTALRYFARRATWRQKLLLLLCSLVVGLLLCEGLVRLMHLAPKVERINPGISRSPYRLSENPILGYVYKENFRGREDDPLPIPVPYVNAIGFQDRERNYEKPPGVRRIIVIGDSVAACGLPQVLEQTLKSQNIEVLNFGVNGYCTRAEVEILQERGLKFNPDLVLLLFVDNDYYNINGDLGWAAQKLPAPVEWGFLHSHLFRVVSLRLNWFELGLRMGMDDFAGEWIGFIPEDQKAVEGVTKSEAAGHRLLTQHLRALGKDNVADGLRLLKELAGKHGFAVMIAIWPTFKGDQILDYETVNIGKSELLPEGQPLHIEQLAAAQNFPCLRLSTFFQADARAAGQSEKLKGHTLENYYTKDGLHPSGIGSQVAANALQQIILSQTNLLPHGNRLPGP